jgi:8-amino-7-oxononanoate synthase
MDLDIVSWRESDDTDLFAKARRFASNVEGATFGKGLYYRPVEATSGASVTICGRRVLSLCSNDYLGLTHDVRVRNAAAAAAEEWGPSCTGSRILNGTLNLHLELESKVAAFLQREAALVFTTGYQASLGVIASLAGPADEVLIDKAAHASLADGITLSGARRSRFRHNNLAHLEDLLSAQQRGGRLVVVDGVYSMEGDLADLPALKALKRSHSFRLLVDDAHGIGVVGQGGRGTCSVSDGSAADLIMGTFSKSLASIGGFAAGGREIIDFIRFFGTSMLFTASMSPPNAAAALKALSILETEPELVTKLEGNSAYWRKGLQDAGFDIGASQTAIVPIIVGEADVAIQFVEDLFEAGIYVSPIIYPAVSRNRALVRTSVSAIHEKGDLDFGLDIVARMGRKLGIVHGPPDS